MTDNRFNLTLAEHAVFVLVGRGLMNKQIAYEMSRSEATIKAHVSAILSKTGASSRVQVALAYHRLWPIAPVLVRQQPAEAVQ